MKLPVPGNETREQARRAALRTVGFSPNFRRLLGASEGNAKKLWAYGARDGRDALGGVKRVYPGNEELTLLYPRDGRPQDRLGRPGRYDLHVGTLPHLKIDAERFGKLTHDPCHWIGWKTAAETSERAAAELRQLAVDDLINQANTFAANPDAPMPRTVSVLRSRLVPMIVLRGESRDVPADPTALLAAWRWVGGPAAIELRNEWVVLVGAEGHEAAFKSNTGEDATTVAWLHV